LVSTDRLALAALHHLEQLAFERMMPAGLANFDPPMTAAKCRGTAQVCDDLPVAEVTCSQELAAGYTCNACLAATDGVRVTILR
jgi:hypothetical protein